MKRRRSNQNRSVVAGAAAIAFLIFMPALAAAQAGGNQEPSVADLARKQRKQDAKETKKAAKVFTNDDFPASHASEPAAKAGSDSAGEAAKPAPPDSDSGPHDEAYFRGKMKRLRDQLKTDQARLAQLESEKDEHEKDVPFDAVVLRSTDKNATVSQPNNTQVEKTFTTDPRWTTDPEGAKRDWEAKEHELADSIGDQKDKIADDQKDISDFVDQCRRENCQPGWIR